jgi:phosphatidylinositol alpha-1,6-mannosyltransferase
MRILVLSPSVYPQHGGLPRYTYNLAVSLVGRGHAVHLLTLDEARGFTAPSANLTYSPVKRWGSAEGTVLAKLWQKVYLEWVLQRTIRRFDPDRIICTWWDPLGYLALPLSKLQGIPLICVGHGQEVIRLPGRAWARWVKRWLRSLTFRHAARVIAVSRFTKERIKDIGLHGDQVQVVPNGLSSHYIEQASEYARKESRALLKLKGRIVLQVGRLVPRKGHELVLEAFQRIQETLDETVRYVIVGSGPYRQRLEGTATSMGIAEEIVFTGFVPDDELHHYYSASDLVVMPAHNPTNAGDVEGFGIVYLEAYAHGKPVIGAEAGGAPDAIVHEETGLLIPPGDSEALAAGILRLLEDPAEAASMGSYGQELLQTRWNWDWLCDAFLL